MLEKRIVYRLPGYGIFFLLIGYSFLFYQVNHASFVDLPFVQFIFIALAYSGVFLAVRHFMVDKSGYFRRGLKILFYILCLYMLYFIVVVTLLFLLPRQWTSSIYKPHLTISLLQVGLGLAVFFFKYSLYACLIVLFESRISALVWMGKRLLLVKKLQIRNNMFRHDASQGKVRALVREEVAHLLRNLLQQLYAWKIVSQTEKQHVDRLLHYVLDGLSDEKLQFVTLDQEMEAVERLNQIYHDKQVDLLYPDRLGGHLVPRFMLVSLLQNCQKHGVYDGSALLEIQLSRYMMHIKVYNKIAHDKDWQIGTDGTGMGRWRDIVRYYYADAAEVFIKMQDDHYLLTVTIDYKKQT
ncbi:hypothetical protein OKW96_05425 [Sphingobacterium sp. KU25419]|nr:hypothetical protein OKW96_05425 [Sphingobacterium sp. KU25419]